MNRRTLLLGATAAGLLAPAIARAQTAARSYRLERGGSDIGHHDLTVTRAGEELVVAIDIDITVRLLGIVAYRYTMVNEERWQGGTLASIRSRTDNNGEDAFVTAHRAGGVIEIEGSTYSGTAPLDSGTTTYWTPAMLERPTWIATQGGKPLAITPTRAGRSDYPTQGGSVPATAWTLGPELAATLFYTDAGEWAGSTFDARGAQVRYLAASLTPPLAPLWRS
ncbi:DUF6134 family protein [Roseobacter sp. HKCCA0434]|uniref:DUF6134 family protein n=1 Tax=Roseobacter sp. HKCCA0434 TaxID=3079297 RepID=UPI002905C300|nr:DUF6134 family protein [Roseobacter sp. HKCCA0434]